MSAGALAGELVDGRLRFSAEAVRAAGLEAVASCALLREGTDLWLIPLRDAAHGGFLLKRRNARGDRVLDAADFFRRNPPAAPGLRSLRFDFRPERAAYVARHVFESFRQDV